MAYRPHPPPPGLGRPVGRYPREAPPPIKGFHSGLDGPPSPSFLPLTFAFKPNRAALASISANFASNAAARSNSGLSSLGFARRASQLFLSLLQRALSASLIPLQSLSIVHRSTVSTIARAFGEFRVRERDDERDARDEGVKVDAERVLDDARDARVRRPHRDRRASRRIFDVSRCRASRGAGRATNRFGPRNDDDGAAVAARTRRTLERGSRSERVRNAERESHRDRRSRARGAVVGRASIRDGGERVRVDVAVRARRRARVRPRRLPRRRRASTAANFSPVGAHGAVDDTAVEIFDHRVGVQAHGIDRIRRGVVTRLLARRVDVLDRRQHRARRRVRQRRGETRWIYTFQTTAEREDDDGGNARSGEAREIKRKMTTARGAKMNGNRW